jgi:hypothetical protein
VELWEARRIERIHVLNDEIEELTTALKRIEQIVRTPTEGKMRAYTHFMRDFDEIRALCRKTLAQSQ